jgi:phosphatidylglycerol lysyltransferase
VIKIVEQARHFNNRNRTLVSIAAVIGLAALGFYALHHLLAEVHINDVRAAVKALQPWQIAAALGLTAASYVLLTFYDVLALQIIGKPLPYRTAALASFTSYTLSHNLGLALLTGGSARYRIYSANGLDAADIVRVIATASITFWSGVSTMAAVALVVHSSPLAFGTFTVSVELQRLAGSAILCASAWMLWKARKPNQSLRLFGWNLPLPSTRQALMQICVAGLDLAAASAALYVLVPGVTAYLFPLFFLGYSLAIIVALITHVPGGVGVFEAVILAALPQVAKPELLAALIAYRAIYYVLPLVFAAVMLAVHEHRLWRKPAGVALDVSHSVISGIAPMLLSSLAFVGGIVLLISGSLPALPHRLQALHNFVPLPFIEASHIAASLAGTALLLLAPGLYKRLDGAFVLTRLMLVAGAIFSLAKGFDYEEALILLLIAGLLQWTRTAFYRRTAFTVRSFSNGWIAAVAVAILLSLWVGTFAYKHVDYQSDLWWQFAWKGDASRFLRASFGAAVMLIATVLIWLFRPAAQRETNVEPQLPDLPEAFAHCDRTEAMLAWTGDKRIMESASGKSFLMYQIQGHSWIVMGDPIGPLSEWPDLFWQMREFADAAQGRLLLYQLSPAALPIAIDLGLQLVKYGEEARVDLTAFKLDGPEAKGLRYTERRAERDGATFEIIPAVQVPGIMAELRQVSDAWLLAKGQSEKTFSVGRFDPAYLSRFDCAVIRHSGRIVAFANVWATDNKHELSIDLMRHADVMPYGTMDFLFINLMKWGQSQGYLWFTLGLAPLSGIEARRLAPIWARAGAFLYRHGESFYGFEGLRAYKDKFSPVWEPRYIAGPHGVGLARSLIDLQTLVGGGRGSASKRPKLALVA